MYASTDKDDAHDSAIYHTNLQKEMLHWRAELRDAEYLLTPKRQISPCSLSNKVLDPDFAHFSQKCKDNLFISQCSKVNSVNTCKLEPVFILPDDRKSFNSIERKNKQEITQLILQDLDRVEDQDFEMGLQQNRLWKEVKNEKRAILIKFCKDLRSIIEHMDSRQTTEDESEGDRF
ncbi:uncharacterized protein LOC134250607 [Saccostrea cucullata]|uniref:uncharacterized protein LOC134250607 n=1 Tax=Saccostrea cuccullata TaxID=36930 RepID=UPI002ED0C8B4